MKQRIPGKKIGGFIYVHVDFVQQHPDVSSLVQKAEKNFGFVLSDFTLAKANPSVNKLSLLFSPDWDSASEPSLSYAVIFDFFEHSFKSINYKNGPIYHHKWMFVGDDYEGFNVEQSKKRSLYWENYGLLWNKKKIGNRDFWQEHVLSIIENRPTSGVHFNVLLDKFPDLFNDTKKRHPTQIAKTVSTYEKVIDFALKENILHKNSIVLDVGSGLGCGKEAFEKKGIIVDDLEPFPKEGYKPKYKHLSEIEKGEKYDFVICSMVLNVVTIEIRKYIIRQIENSLKPGGYVFFSVRSLKEIEKQKTGIPVLTEDKDGENKVFGEYYFPQRKTFQKGFSEGELNSFIEEYTFTLKGVSLNARFKKHVNLLFTKI